MFAISDAEIAAIQAAFVAAAIWWKPPSANRPALTGPVSYVIRAPSAVTSAEEWLRLYAPQDVTDEIEIDGEAETALTHPCAQWPSLAHITSSGLWRLIFQQGP